MKKRSRVYKTVNKSTLHVRKIFLLSIHLMSIIFTGFTQQFTMPDSGRYIVYNWLRPIGQETYKITRQKDRQHVSINYFSEDRGIKIPLQVRATFTKYFSPLSMVIRGKTGRNSSIDDSIVIAQDRMYINRRDTSYIARQSKNSFLLSDDLPVTMLTILVKFWEANGRPSKVQTLPDNYAIEIKYMGRDTITSQDITYTFERYRIDRGKWMFKYFWTNTNGEFAALTPGFGEVVNEKYNAFLTQFRTKTAQYVLNEFPANKKTEIPVVITNANLVDVTTGEKSPFSTVIIEGGKIAWVGPANKASIPKKAKLINAKGLTLLPGLWDMHVHYAFGDLGPAYLGMGITTVRDCANEFEFIRIIKELIDGDRNIGPNILRAGLIDGSGPNTLSIVTADNKEEAIARVQNYKQAGYDQIKIYSSVKPQMVKVICDEAHKLGMTVTGHIPTGMKVSACIDSGMNAINHIANFFNGFEIDTATQTIDFSKEANRMILEKLKTNQTVIDPTVSLYQLTRRSFKTPVKNIYPSYSTWPKFLQAEISTVGLSDDTIRKYKLVPRFEGYKKLIQKLFQEGILVVAGSDAPLLPGYSLYRELELYVSAGLTPLQAIQTATLIPARVMNQLAQRGTIEVGKIADLILIDGDPLKQISDIQKVKWVFKDGQIYNAQNLRNRVGFE